MKRPSRGPAILVALAAVAVTTVGTRLVGANPPTAGFLFLLVVLFSATGGGLGAGIAASLAATIAFNYFFFPPIHTFHIADAENWVALGAFLVVSIVASRLVTRARTQAERLLALAMEREQLLAQRAHVEALKESESMKTALLRAVSHDLATPLTAITVQVASLQRQLAGEKATKTLAILADEVARLRRRIDNLLAMARLETGSIEPRPEPIPPQDLFRAARENLGVPGSSAAFQIRVAHGCPDVFADPSLALEIIVNLVENGRRASSGGAIDLVADRHPDDPAKVRLGILDRGHGIVGDAAEIDPAEIRPRGLGLEIARRFAEASAGAVVLAPRSGGGTSAWVDLPVASAGEGGAFAGTARPGR